jgi:hypothetical protein
MNYPPKEVHVYCDESHTEHKLYIHLDERSTTYRLSKFRPILNRGIKKKLGHPIDVVLSIDPVDSKMSNVMQIADVIMGAVGWTANGQPGTRQSRIALADHSAKRAHVPSLKASAPGTKRFKVWQVVLSQKNEKRLVR